MSTVIKLYDECHDIDYFATIEPLCKYILEKELIEEICEDIPNKYKEDIKETIKTISEKGCSIDEYERLKERLDELGIYIELIDVIE